MRHGCRTDHVSRADRLALSAGARGSAPWKWIADILDRWARGHCGERKQGACSLGIGELEVRLAVRAHHRESRAGGCAEGRRAIRLADRSRHPRRSGQAEATGGLDGAGSLRVLRRACVERRAQVSAGHVARRCQRQLRPARIDRSRGRSGGGLHRHAEHRARRPTLARRLRAHTRHGSAAGALWFAEQRAASAVVPSRPARYSRPAAGETRVSDRGGRRSQCAVHRSAGFRQEHARAATARAASTTERCRSTRVRDDRLGERERFRQGGLRTPAVSLAASHRIGVRDDWRRPACGAG